MSADVSRKILRNTVFIFFGRLWFLGLSLLLTPYFLTRLGTAGYGVWVLIDSVARTVGLIDLGLATAFVKHVAEHDARGDRESVSGVLTTGLVFYAAIGTVILGVALFGVGPILDFFRVPADLEDTAHSVLRLALIASIFGNLVGVYHSVINGLQKMDVSNAIMVFVSLAYALGCVIALEGGYGLVGLATSLLVTQLVGIALSHFATMKLYPGIAFRFGSVGAHWASMFRYGINVYVGNIASLVNVHFDKMLVNRFVGAMPVALYDVGARPTTTARSFATLLLSSITPAASELEAREGQNNLYGLYVKASRVVAVIAIPLFLGLIVTSRPLVGAWVGGGYDPAVVVMRILCVGFLLWSLAAPVTPLVQGMGHPRFQRNAELVSLILNIVLSLALVVRYGLYGAPAGTATAMSIAACYYLWVFHRFMDRPLTAFLKQTYAKPLLCGLAATGVAAMVTSTFAPEEPAGRLMSLAMVALAGSVFAVVYVVGLLASRYLQRDEIGTLRSFVRFLGRDGDAKE